MEADAIDDLQVLDELEDELEEVDALRDVPVELGSSCIDSSSFLEDFGSEAGDSSDGKSSLGSRTKSLGRPLGKCFGLT